MFAPAALPKMPIGVNVLTFALSALGAIVLVLRGSPYRHGDGVGIGRGRLPDCLLVIAQAAAAFTWFKSSGEAMPDFKAMQANRTAGAVPPPPPGYSTPPPAATYPPATPARDFTLDDTQPPASTP